jgi:predicted RNA-binding Zn ribbon-like protein
MAPVEGLPAQHLSLGFYDHTKTARGAWCSMRVCGSRAKARAHRARRVASRAPMPAQP